MLTSARSIVFQWPIWASNSRKTIKKTVFKNLRLSSQNKLGKSNNNWPTDLAEIQRLPIPSFQALVKILLNKKNISDFCLLFLYQRHESITEILRDLITTRFNDGIPSKGPTITRYKYRHYPLCFSDRFWPPMAKEKLKNHFKTSDLRLKINQANQITNDPLTWQNYRGFRYLHFKP